MLWGACNRAENPAARTTIKKNDYFLTTACSISRELMELHMYIFLLLSYNTALGKQQLHRHSSQ